MNTIKANIKSRLPYLLVDSGRGYGEELTIEEILDVYNKSVTQFDMWENLPEDMDGESKTKIKEFLGSKAATMEFADVIKETLNNNQLYWADYQFYGDVFKRIEYEPFKTVFETSGKIIVENDLRDYYGHADYNVNATIGIIETMKHYADKGMLHGFVGNSCPTLIISEEHGQINIGIDWDEETDEMLYPDDTYKDLTSVCTDLWWYSIADLQTFQKENPDVDTSQFEIVEIPKGRWELSHKYGVSETGYHENLPYATLTHLGE